MRGLRKLQKVGVAVQAAGLLALLAAWKVAAQGYHYDLTVLGGIVVLIVGGLVFTTLVRTPAAVFVMAIVTVGLLAQGFVIITQPSPVRVAWCMALATVFSLVMAPIFASFRHHVGGLVTVWAVFSQGQRLTLSPDYDPVWNTMFVAVVVGMGMFLNSAYSTLREYALRQHLRLAAMAYQDALTGIDNRRTLMERLRTLHETHALQQVHLLMVDIDDFKQINDWFGHDQGDAVLQALAACLQAQVPEHRAVRLGGEEFAMLVEGGDRQDALDLAERLVVAARAIRRHPADAPPDRHAGLTISTGVASGRPDDTPASLLRRCDQALYAAKRAGKNRVADDTRLAGASESAPPGGIVPSITPPQGEVPPVRT